MWPREGGPRDDADEGNLPTPVDDLGKKNIFFFFLGNKFNLVH